MRGCAVVERSTMSRLGSMIWTLLAAVLTVMLCVQLADRFAGNGKAWTFYAPDIDMTCVVGKEGGQQAMYCLPGDRRAVAGGTDDV